MRVSPEPLRILHAVRLLGFAGTDEIADRAGATRDARILDELELLSRALAPLIVRLTVVLPWFAGYDERFAAAVVRARAGEPEWVDRTSLDSCHRVWFQLHEDLLATLGIERGDEEAESDDRAGDGAGDDRAGGEEGPRADR